MLEPTFRERPWKKLGVEDVRVTILTDLQKYAEAKVLSNRIIADLNKYVRGPMDTAAWIYFDRVILAVQARDPADLQKARSQLNSTVAKMPALGFLGDLGAYMADPKGHDAKAALARAVKVLGSEHPTIKQVQRLMSSGSTG
jgi:hypothetical protein